MDTNTEQTVSVRAVAEQVLVRHGHSANQIDAIKVTKCDDGRLQFDVECNIPMADVNIRFIGLQNRPPQLVTAGSDDEL